VAWWSGSEGNYWGHNAIIRVDAFARHAGLPRLPGRKPFGGDILSHDFVEAALLRRGGWRVCLAAGLGGSYEESPPTLTDLFARDRRWSQGNLQHARVIGAKGLHWISRFHLLRGLSAYLVSPLWLALLASAAILPLRPEWGERLGAPLKVAAVRLSDIEGADAAFVAMLFFLLGPKLLAYVQMLRTEHERRRFGGARMAALNVAIETLISTLVAPLIMVSHTGSIAAALAGRDSGWTAQKRDETGPSLGRSLRLLGHDMALGVGLALGAVSASLHVFLWLSPVIAGLVLAVPLDTVLASGRLGRAARRAGILLTPEERRPPQILVRASADAAGWTPSPQRFLDARAPEWHLQV
jgi:membrane glycosyltransferase